MGGGRLKHVLPDPNPRTLLVQWFKTIVSYELGLLCTSLICIWCMLFPVFPG